MFGISFLKPGKANGAMTKDETRDALERTWERWAGEVEHEKQTEEGPVGTI